MSKELIKNGKARSNTGFRQVLFDGRDLALAPVALRRYSGEKPGRTTYQVGPKTGDLLARCSWRRAGEMYELLRWSGVAWEPAEIELWSSLRELHPWIDSWLDRAPRGPSYLPAEVAPPERDLAAISKKRKINRFFEKYGVPYEYGEPWELSPMSGIHMEPRELDIEPDEVRPYDISIIGSMVDIHEMDRWYSSDGDGSPAIELTELDRREDHRSNYAHDEPSWAEGSDGLPGWSARRYLIRVVHGAYDRDHTSYGRQVDVWIVPK